MEILYPEQYPLQILDQLYLSSGYGNLCMTRTYRNKKGKFEDSCDRPQTDDDPGGFVESHDTSVPERQGTGYVLVHDDERQHSCSRNTVKNIGNTDVINSPITPYWIDAVR